LNGGNLILTNSRLKAVIIELNGSGKRYGFNDDDIDNLLKSYGFKPYTYNPFDRELIYLDNYTNHNTIYLRYSSEVSNKLKHSNSVRLSNGLLL